MKLRQYIKELQALDKQYPGVEVICYSILGDSYKAPNFPSVGDLMDGDFVAFDEQNPAEFNEEFEINAVCLN